MSGCSPACGSALSRAAAALVVLLFLSCCLPAQSEYPADDEERDLQNDLVDYGKPRFGGDGVL